jgi:hypothetical protein
LHPKKYIFTSQGFYRKSDLATWVTQIVIAWVALHYMKSDLWCCSMCSALQPSITTDPLFYFCHLDTGISWFPWVQEWMLWWFPPFQVASTCFSCSPPDLNSVVTNRLLSYYVKWPLSLGDNPTAVNKYYYYYYPPYLPQIKSAPLYRHWGSVRAVRPIGGVEVQLYSFMTTALERGWGVNVTPRPLFTHGEYRRLGGPQGRSGQVRKISPPPGFDPRTVQPVASCYTDWATRPTQEEVLPP